MNEMQSIFYKGKIYSDTKEVVLKKASNILERTDEKTQRKQVEDEHDAFGRHKKIESLHILNYKKQFLT